MKDTNLLLDSRLFNPSTAFHDADIGVLKVCDACGAAMALGGKSNVIKGAAAAVLVSFWSCSITSRRVDVVVVERMENACVEVMKKKMGARNKSIIIVKG